MIYAKISSLTSVAGGGERKPSTQIQRKQADIKVVGHRVFPMYPFYDAHAAGLKVKMSGN
jgi:hypothetical protein